MEVEILSQSYWYGCRCVPMITGVSHDEMVKVVDDLESSAPKVKLESLVGCRDQ